jgi:two-component system phosphate regulon response regulator PhoB
MARILVIEDEEDLQTVLGLNLQFAGHEHIKAVSGYQGIGVALERVPDLVVLDWMLPDLVGTEVCMALKREQRTRHIPVLMLTARGEEADRVHGFELGVDDYVVKPFSVRELMLRIEVLLRRQVWVQAGEEVDWVLGGLKMSRSEHRVWVEEKEICLTAIEFKLLEYLWEHRNKVVDRTTLLEKVWDIQAEITTRTVDVHVKRLREKLGAVSCCIETVRGVGYRLVGEAWVGVA